MKAYQFSVQGDLRRICAESREDAEAACVDRFGGFDVENGEALCKRCNSMCDNCATECSGETKKHYSGCIYKTKGAQ
jgi:hypothetical protein